MKKQKFNQKLILNKSVVAQLNKRHMNKIAGGTRMADGAIFNDPSDANPSINSELKLFTCVFM